MPILLQRTGRLAERKGKGDGRQSSSAVRELLIVPTRRRVRSLLRETLLASARAVATPLPVQTLETFAEILYAASSSAHPLISRSFRTFLFAHAVRQLKNQLQFFTPRPYEPYIFPGTFDRIVATVIGLRDAGVTSSELEAELQKETGDDRAKLHDLALLARGYEHHLQAYGLQDEAGVLRFLGNTERADLERLLNAAFPQEPHITLDGFDQFSEPEIQFIERLSGIPGLTVAVHIDYYSGNEGLFGHLTPFIQRLTDAGFSTREREARSAARPVDQLAPLLFHPSPVKLPAEHVRPIIVVRAPDREREVVLICRIIKDAVLRGEIRDLSRICVAMRDLDRYTDIMRELFPRYGIPANITQGFALSRSPLVVDVVALLEMRSFGFRREDVLRVAGSPYFRFLKNETLNVANLATAASRLRVTAGEEVWKEAFRKRGLRLPALASMADDPDEYLESERERLRKARGDFEALVERTTALARSFTPEQFRTKLLTLLEELGVPESIERMPDAFLQEREARAYQLLRGLVEGMTRFHGRGGSSHVRPLHYYLEQLRLAAGRERFNVRDRAGWGVLVTAVEEIRGLSFDLVILPGMVDGEFPATFMPDLFLDARRRQQREERHLLQERYLFYQVLACWRGSLVLTSPMREGDVDLVESPFTDALRRVVDVRDGDPTPPDAVFTAEELLARLAGDAPLVSPLPEPLAYAASEARRVRRVEESRRSTHAMPEYEGMLTGKLSGRARAMLLHLKEEVFSVSQLEEYGSCPFRFLLTRLLRLQIPELFAEEISAAERGAVIHEVLFTFFLDRRTRRLPPLRLLKEQAFEQAVEDMRGIARRILKGLDIPDLFWEFEQERILGVPGKRRGILRAFLEAERARTDDVQPLYFEAAFGRGKRADPTDPQLTRPQPLRAGSIALKGKIDRIDGNDRCYTVIDYKTGAGIPTMEEIRSGASLQLPLYLHVVEQLLRSTGRPLVPAGGLYYQIRDPVRLRLGIGSAEWNGKAFPEVTGRRRLVGSEAELRDVIATAVRTAEQHVDAMARGEFPVSPVPGEARSCSTCELAAICRSRTVARGSSQLQEDT